MLQKFYYYKYHSRSFFLVSFKRKINFIETQTNEFSVKNFFEHNHNQPIKIGQRCAGKLSILRHHTCIFPVLVLSFLVFSSCPSVKNYARLFGKVPVTLLKMLGSIKVVLLLGVIYLCRAAEEDVLDLSDSDFASTLAQHDTALVMFYAPW